MTIIQTSLIVSLPKPPFMKKVCGYIWDTSRWLTRQSNYLPPLVSTVASCFLNICSHVVRCFQLFAESREFFASISGFLPKIIGTIAINDKLSHACRQHFKIPYPTILVNIFYVFWTQFVFTIHLFLSLIRFA